LIGRAVIGVATAAVLAGGAFAIERQHQDPPAASVSAQETTATVTRTDLAAAELVNATLGFSPSAPVIVRRPGTYTWLPEEGAVIEPGQPLARVDGRPVVLMAGTSGAWRAFRSGMTDGDDVAQLEYDLAALGFGQGLTVDRHFSGATRTAIRRWQRALGVPVTGTVADGDIVFLPSAIRVGAIDAAIGAAAGPGQPPYAATSTARVVHADLDAARQEGVTAGMAVTVDLPGGAKAAAKIASIGRVASVPSGDNGGNRRATVPLTVTLDDPLAAGPLDQQPVTIELVTDSRKGVLAVPVTALMALAEGGYGVEVVPTNGPHHVVAVTPGLFASGLVEITGDSVSEGTEVVAAP
jgi:peptidoglycan hydrolase-like protein with peptidoglycan-binding domain